MWAGSEMRSEPALGAQHWTMEWDNTQLHFDLSNCFHHQVGHGIYVRSVSVCKTIFYKTEFYNTKCHGHVIMDMKSIRARARTHSSHLLFLLLRNTLRQLVTSHTPEAGWPSRPPSARWTTARTRSWCRASTELSAATPCRGSPTLRWRQSTGAHII